MIRRITLTFILAIAISIPLLAENSILGTAQSQNIHFEKAKIKLALKQYSKALHELILARRKNPQDPEIVNLMGLTYLKSGKIYIARAYFKKAINMNKNFAIAYNNLGAVYHLRKKYKKAIKYYKKAVEINPQYLLAYYNMANAYFARKKYLQAIDVMHKIVQIDPNYLLKEHNELQIGVYDLNQGKRYYYYAKLYAQVGDIDKVIYFLQKSLNAGFKVKKKIYKDKDFASFLKDPRIQALLQK